MPWVMEILSGPGIDSFTDDAPHYVKAFDVEARDGVGEFTATRDIAAAYQWDSMVALMEGWKTQCKSRPLRPDGKPNRPLTALSISPREYKL